MDIEAEIRRVARQLEIEICVAGFSKRTVERKLGWGSGTLTKVVKGDLELRLRHILAVAQVTGLDVTEFFQKTFPRRIDPEKAETAAELTVKPLEPVVDRTLAHHLQALETALTAAIREASTGSPSPRD